MESHVHLYLCYYKTAALRELSLMKAELVLETPLIRNKLMVNICVHLCLIHFRINTSGWKTLTVWEISVWGCDLKKVLVELGELYLHINQ